MEMSNSPRMRLSWRIFPLHQCSDAAVQAEHHSQKKKKTCSLNICLLFQDRKHTDWLKNKKLKQVKM